MNEHVSKTEESTHSHEFELPNGQKIVIPDPSSKDGWELQEERHHDWPHLYAEQYAFGDSLEFMIGQDIVHNTGKTIFKKYEKQLCAENARIVYSRHWKRVSISI